MAGLLEGGLAVGEQVGGEVVVGVEGDEGFSAPVIWKNGQILGV